MKRLLPILLLLFVAATPASRRHAMLTGRGAAAGGGGSYNKLFDRSAAGAASGGDATTSTVDSSGATLIVIGVSYYITAPTVSDSKGNTWTALTAEVQTSASARLYYCENPTVGSGHTFTGADGDGVAVVIHVLGFSGNAATPFDAETGDQTPTMTTLQAGSITPAGANELFVSLLTINNVTLDATVDSGFTALATLDSGDGVPSGILAYKIKSDATAENPTWTAVGGTPVASTVLAAFK